MLFPILVSSTQLFIPPLLFLFFFLLVSFHSTGEFPERKLRRREGTIEVNWVATDASVSLRWAFGTNRHDRWESNLWMKNPHPVVTSGGQKNTTRGRGRGSKTDIEKCTQHYPLSFSLSTLCEFLTDCLIWKQDAKEKSESEEEEKIRKTGAVIKVKSGVQRRNSSHPILCIHFSHSFTLQSVTLFRYNIVLQPIDLNSNIQHDLICVWFLHLLISSQLFEPKKNKKREEAW